VILSVLVCDIWINVLLQTSAFIGPLYIVNWNARWNSEIHSLYILNAIYREYIKRENKGKEDEGIEEIK
jgi:hypothetical protein